MNNQTSRRKVLKQLAAGSLAAAVIQPLQSFANNNMEEEKLKGNINHSVCQWTYNSLTLEQLCIEVKKMGMKGIDLIGPKDWPTLQKHDLQCSMCYIGGKVSLNEGCKNPKFKEHLIKYYL